MGGRKNPEGMDQGFGEGVVHGSLLDQKMVKGRMTRCKQENPHNLFKNNKKTPQIRSFLI